MSLAFQSATKVYRSGSRTNVAVDCFSLEVQTNEFVCLVGPSGCGKTTVLNMAAGFLLPDRGTVRHNGDEITGPTSNRAVVFQEDAVFPWYTVWHNVAYGPRVQNLPAEQIATVTDRYLEVVGLTTRAHEYPKELSGGMKKRVDLARAYASRPDTLLMDEPFGSLDVITRRRMQGELLRIWETERKTILFVTHDIQEALFLADRVAVMSADGHILDHKVVGFPRPRDHSLFMVPSFLNAAAELESLLGLV